MNADSPIFVPQAAVAVAIAVAEPPNSPFGSPPTTPTGGIGVSNAPQWPHFATRNPSNMHFYHQQHLRQQQQQLQHLFQQQRNFFNPNLHYQWAQMSMAAAVPLLPQQQQQQQQQQPHHKRCQTPKQQQQQQQQQQQLRHKQKDTTKQQQQRQQQQAIKKTTKLVDTVAGVDTIDGDDSIAHPEPELSTAKAAQLANKPEVPTKQDDTTQPNGSRASHSIKAHHHHQHHQLQNHHQQQQQHQHHHHHHQHQQQPQHLHLNTKHDSSDSGVSTNGQQQRHQHQHHHQQHQHQQQQSHAKQRKSRSNTKRQDGTTVPNIDAKQRTSNFTVDDWLDRDMMYCYERRYISSCAEDNMPRHNPIHRNSTSSDAAASDDLNSSSSNEDLSAAFSVISKANKKSGKARQNRQQKRKSQEARNARNALITGPEPMDIDDDSAKENQRPANNGGVSHVAQHKNANANLRKQCTKAAAFKAAASKHINHNHNNDTNNSGSGSSGGGINKSNVNALSTSPSNSSVCSTLSSASSTLSLSSSSISSSASNSPTNSANCSPTASPTASKRTADNYKKIARTFASPLRQHAKLNMSESELVQQLRRYVIDPNLLRVYGFPVESAIHEGCIEIYKCLPKPYHHAVSTHISSKSSLINTKDGLTISYSATSVEQQWTLGDDGNGSGDSGDSGQVSGDSSPPSVDSDSSEAGEDETVTTTACYTPDGSYQIFSQYDQSLEKQCARCQRAFHVTETGEYLSRESCVFHWGKLYKVYAGIKGFVPRYTCCQRGESAEGCSQNPLHVWTGAVVGLNGPYADFVHTRPRYDSGRTAAKVYALDCEMSFTGRGLEVTKVTVIGYDGQLVYEHFVRPEVEIVDYNTRFSGITEQDLCTDSNQAVKTLPEVQRDLLQLIDTDTILIGHALDNDLRVLRIVHKTIVDTSITFPHVSGFPYRRSLKHLTKAHLHRDIQCGDAGHSSLEDSRACLELMLWKVRKDVRY